MGIGGELAAAIAAKDHAALTGLLAPDIDFRALTPGRPWLGINPDEVADAFDQWFGPDDRIENMAGVREGEDVADTHHLSYRLELRNDRGRWIVEQQAYYRLDDEGRVGFLRVLCSGFRPR